MQVLQAVLLILVASAGGAPHQALDKRQTRSVGITENEYVYLIMI